MVDARNPHLVALLHAHGLRVTPQRRAVYAAFDDGRAGHLSAHEVLRRARGIAPAISLATVYNTLSQFVAAGLLGTVQGPGCQLYDPNVAPHDHFRCRVCARLLDVHLQGVDRLTLTDPGYVVERASVIFHGTCPSCTAEHAAAPEAGG
jgi:Fur family peroxide stress response transcriptional regulator